jgi:diacylglycerol kinase (ATP)
VDGQAVTRVGVLINPTAGRGNGKGLALASALKAHGGVGVDLLERFDQLAPILQRMGTEGVEDLFISSGDGTVHAIQTLLAEKGWFRQMPRLCLLPHGTTNLNAADVGFQSTSIAAQAALIANATPREVIERHSLRLANPRDGVARHGMFFGTGAITDATRYTQVNLNDKGVKGSYATFAVLAKAISKTLFSAPNPHDPNRFDRPYPITLMIDGEPLCEDPQLLALATTLDKLILNTRPFWGGKTAPIRITTFPYPLPNVLRWFLPAVMGGESRRPVPGAHSTCAHGFSITSSVAYDLDGEFYEGPDDGPLKVETGPLFRFIRR